MGFVPTHTLAAICCGQLDFRQGGRCADKKALLPFLDMSNNRLQTAAERSNYPSVDHPMVSTDLYVYTSNRRLDEGV